MDRDTPRPINKKKEEKKRRDERERNFQLLFIKRNVKLFYTYGEMYYSCESVGCSR